MYASSTGSSFRPYLFTLALVLATTPMALFAANLVGPGDAELVFLVPVMIAAVHWGLGPAIVGVAVSMVTSAFLIHVPVFSLAISSHEDALSLALLTIVAVVTSKLADAARAHAAEADAARRRIGTLYAFSRRLASAAGAEDIRRAVQEHIAELVGVEALLVTDAETNATGDQQTAGLAATMEIVRPRVRCFLSTGEPSQVVLNAPGGMGQGWLLCRMELGLPRPAVLVLGLPSTASASVAALRERVDAVLADVVQTLERVQFARAMEDRRLKAEAEQLRDAFIGSVSHGLRTPLSAIVGSASVLAEASAVARDTRLAGLTAIIATEAERLDKDIQRLLDAARIEGSAVAPSLAWVDANDLVNTALGQLVVVLGKHRVTIETEPEIPFVRADSVLVMQALVQLLDNAAKYAPEGSTIAISITSRGGGETVTIDVVDDGIGLQEGEGAQLTERFFRGKVARETTRGSGLGLWIARAFVTASGGQLVLLPASSGHGTLARITLNAASSERMRDLENSDE